MRHVLLSWFNRKKKYKQLAFPYSTDSLNAAMLASIYLFMTNINVEAVTDFCLFALFRDALCKRKKGLTDIKGSVECATNSAKYAIE